MKWECRKAVGEEEGQQSGGRRQRNVRMYDMKRNGGRGIVYMNKKG